MLKKMFPLILLLLGSGAGVGAGIALRPVSAPVAEIKELKDDTPKSVKVPLDNLEYVKLNNQFVVPVVKKGKVDSLVVMALSIEVPEGQKENVFKHEPKLRDSFLQVMFDHANIGGFDGAFTDVSNLSDLRNALREIGQNVLGRKNISDILITEIARQDY